MSNNEMGIIIGGVAPAIILGLFMVFQKLATRNGAGPGQFLIILGGISAVIGGILFFAKGEPNFPVTGILWSILSSACWGISMAGVAYALFKFHIPIGKLNPIFNTNTLTSVLIGIIFLGEWSQVEVYRVIAGAIIIITGAIIVSKA